MTAHKVGTIDQWRGTLFCLSSGMFFVFHISDSVFFSFTKEESRELDHFVRHQSRYSWR